MAMEEAAGDADDCYLGIMVAKAQREKTVIKLHNVPADREHLGGSEAADRTASKAFIAIDPTTSISKELES